VRLALLGELNSGKTTFINALLGSSLLSAAPIPTTNVVTRIAHGAIFSCQATLADGSQIGITEENVSTYSTGEIDLASLDVRLPLSLLEDGLVLLDTPGFNVQNERHEHLVDSAVSAANACVFLIDARQPGKKTTIDFLKSIQSKIDKFFFVVNRSDIYNDDEFEEAQEYLLDVLQREVNISNPRLYFISSSAALVQTPSIWHDRLEELISDIRDVLHFDHDSLILAELGQLLGTTYARTSHLVQTQVRSAELELAEKYHRLLPDSGQLIHDLQSELALRLPAQFATFEKAFEIDHRKTFDKLESMVAAAIANASSKSEIREEVPEFIHKIFTGADEHLQEFVKNKSSEIFAGHQKTVGLAVKRLFEGLRFVEHRLFLSSISTWICSILGCFAGLIAGYYLSVETSRRIWAALGGFLISFLICYSSYKARGSSSFTPPEFQTLDQLLSAASSLMQGEVFQRQANAEETQRGVQKVGYGAFRVANSVGIVGNIPGLGLIGAGVGLGIMALGAAWDWLTGPSLSALKKEMSQKCNEAVAQFSSHWLHEGNAFIAGVHELQEAALRDHISLTVHRYEGLLNKLLQREKGIVQALEIRRNSLQATLESLEDWKDRLSHATADIKVQMRKGRNREVGQSV